MTVTGNPPWLRTTTPPDYGGVTGKRNWGGLGVVDALTDVDAAQFLRLTADLAALTRVAPMAVLAITDTNTLATASSQTGNLTVNSALTPWGVSSTSYSGDAAPPGMPSVVLGSTPLGWGYIIDLGANRADDFGAVATPAPQMAAVDIQLSDPETARVGVSGTQVYFVRYFSGNLRVGGAAQLHVRIW